MEFSPTTTLQFPCSVTCVRIPSIFLETHSPVPSLAVFEYYDAVGRVDDFFSVAVRYRTILHSMYAVAGSNRSIRRYTRVQVNTRPCRVMLFRRRAFDVCFLTFSRHQPTKISVVVLSQKYDILIRLPTRGHPYFSDPSAVRPFSCAREVRLFRPALAFQYQLQAAVIATAITIH